MYDLLLVHAHEQAEGVLTEVHRAAGRIEQGDVTGALEPLHLTRITHPHVADPLTGAGHQVVGRDRPTVPLCRQWRWALRLEHRIRVHLQPEPAQGVVHQGFHHPGWGIELVDDRQLIRAARCSFGFLAYPLLLLAVKKLVNPAKEIRGAIGLNRQIAVDHADQLHQSGMGRPHAGIFMIWIEEKPDLLVDLPVGTLQTIAKQRFFRIVVVLVTGATSRSEVPQIAGAILARNGSEQLCLL